jgi:hypothetical protein
MKSKQPHIIGPTSRWIIFSGLPMAAWAVFFAITEPHHVLEHAVGQKAFPYVLAGVPAAMIIAGMILYDHFPKPLVIPLGTAGWVITAAILCWFFWFGPGALKF